MAGRKLRTGSRRNHPRNIAARLRHAEWVQKALEGYGPTEIAEEYGVAKSTVSEAISRRLAEVGADDAERLRLTWLARIERALTKLWPGMESDDPNVRASTSNALTRLSKRASEIGGFDNPPQAPVDRDGHAMPSFVVVPGALPDTVVEWVREYGAAAEGARDA